MKCQKKFQELIKLLSRFFGPWVGKNVNKNNDKNCKFFKKILKFAMLKCLNHPITTRNIAVTYYQTLE